jgi:hypothetical protein
MRLARLNSMPSPGREKVTVDVGALLELRILGPKYSMKSLFAC